MVAICWGYFDSRKGERVGDLEACCFVHADQKAGRGCRKGLRAMFDNLHDHLLQYQLKMLHAQLIDPYQSLQLDRLQGSIFSIVD